MESHPFGRTGHDSTRILFGAAALGGMRQEKADGILELLLAHGVNHIDTAASYGAAEERIGPWMAEHRERFFLATKTGERTRAGAWDQLRRSLDRLRVDHVDLIQLHNLVDESEWETALGPGGALEAVARAREQGLVRFIGDRPRDASARDASAEPGALPVRQRPRSLQLHDDARRDYAADFERLAATCAARGVALQTIKSVARRRWEEGTSERRFSWYEPLRDEEAVRRAVHFVLARPGLFLNSSSDATLLPAILEAAREPYVIPPEAALHADVARFEMAPLFVRGVSDSI